MTFSTFTITGGTTLEAGSTASVVAPMSTLYTIIVYGTDVFEATVQGYAGNAGETEVWFDLPAELRVDEGLVKVYNLQDFPCNKMRLDIASNVGTIVAKVTSLSS